MPSRCPAAVTATAHMPSASASRPVSAERRTAGASARGSATRPCSRSRCRSPGSGRARPAPAPWAASRLPSTSSTATQHASTSPSTAAMSSTPPPASTTPTNRSCAAAACAMPSCAVDSAASVAAVAAARRDWTSDTAASAASEPSSATSSWWNAATGPVRREQHADELVADQQRRAADPDQPLVVDRRVDLAGVPELLVRGVVGAPVRAAGLRDEPAQAGAQRQPQRLEPRRHRAGRRPHVGVAALGVVQGQVGDVRAQQRAGPAHDRVEDVAGVGQRGQVACGVDERGQLGLPPAVRVEPGAHPQRELAGRLAVVGIGRGQRPGLLLDLLGRRVRGEQPEQLERGAGHGGDPAIGVIHDRARAAQAALARVVGGRGAQRAPLHGLVPAMPASSARSRWLVSV